MIREDEIREFQEIIGGRIYDSETEHVQFDIKEEYLEDFEDAPEEKEIKKENTNPNSFILLITGILGLIFVALVFIGGIMYVYLKNEDDESQLNKSKPSQSLKIPGIERLVTDAENNSDEKVKVWVLRTPVPPDPRIGNYNHLFPPSDNEDNDDENLFLLKHT